MIIKIDFSDFYYVVLENNTEHFLEMCISIQKPPFKLKIDYLPFPKIYLHSFVFIDIIA